MSNKPPTAVSTTHARALMAVNTINTLVINPKITIEVEARYDLDIATAWNAQCLLWTINDDGSLYTLSVPIANSQYVTQNDQYFVITFENVLANKYYSCVIDHGENKTTSIFQHLHITKAMDIKD